MSLLMASKPSKRKVQGGRPTPGGGRVTPKGGHQPERSSTPPASSRYTPPIPQEFKVSPRWVPILMFALLGIGLLVIFLNYLGVLPGETKNSYLLIGLGFILGGIVTATQYR